LVGAGGAEGASASWRLRVLIALMARKMAKAMMTKSTTVWMNIP